MSDYDANKRKNDPAYLLHHVGKLLEIAKEYENSSLLIYACLDSRIALEICDLYLIIASVKPEERQEVLESSKPKNGIDKMNKKHKALKEKYQSFFQILSEISGVSWNNYDFKKSKDLQHKLSSYIHSYYMLDDEVDFHSDTMQSVFQLIDEVREFIQAGLNFNGSEYKIIGVEIATIPEADKELLAEWKEDNITQEELKERIRLNIEN